MKPFYFSHIVARRSAALARSEDNPASRVCEYVKSAQLDVSKMRGIGTDGASTMMGCHNGVVARLKTITPSVIGVHCAAHRLNLASSQAGNNVAYVKKLSNILRQLYDFFDNSAVLPHAPPGGLALKEV